MQYSRKYYTIIFSKLKGFSFYKFQTCTDLKLTFKGKKNQKDSFRQANRINRAKKEILSQLETDIKLNTTFYSQYGKLGIYKKGEYSHVKKITGKRDRIAKNIALSR